MSKQLESIIIDTARELTAEEEIEVDGEITPDTSLFGSDGILDSMGLVSLVVAVEQAVEDELGVRISLADEKALSQRHSPYRTVKALAEYAQAEIEANRDDE